MFITLDRQSFAHQCLRGVTLEPQSVGCGEVPAGGHDALALPQPVASLYWRPLLAAAWPALGSCLSAQWGCSTLGRTPEQSGKAGRGFPFPTRDIQRLRVQSVMVIPDFKILLSGGFFTLGGTFTSDNLNGAGQASVRDEDIQCWLLKALDNFS